MGNAPSKPCVVKQCLEVIFYYYFQINYHISVVTEGLMSVCLVTTVLFENSPLSPSSKHIVLKHKARIKRTQRDLGLCFDTCDDFCNLRKRFRKWFEVFWIITIHHNPRWEGLSDRSNSLQLSTESELNRNIRIKLTHAFVDDKLLMFYALLLCTVARFVRKTF